MVRPLRTHSPIEEVGQGRRARPLRTVDTQNEWLASLPVCKPLLHPTFKRHVELGCRTRERFRKSMFVAKRSGHVIRTMSSVLREELHQRRAVAFATYDTGDLTFNLRVEAHGVLFITVGEELAQHRKIPVVTDSSHIEG